MVTLLLTVAYAATGDLIPEAHDAISPINLQEQHRQVSQNVERIHNTVFGRDVQWPERPSPPFAHDALAVLEVMAQDADPETRLQGLLGLTDVDASESVALLVRALEDPAPEVRDLALRKLGALDTDRLAHELIRRMTSATTETQAEFERGLPRLKDTIEEPMIAVLEAPESDPVTRAAAIRILGAVGSQSAISAIAEAASGMQHTGLVRDAAQALARIASPDCLPPLTELSLHARADVRRAALTGLARIGGPLALSAIEAMALNPRESDLGNRRRAIHYIGLMGGESSVETLINVMNRYPHTRESVTAALTRLTGLNLGNSPLEWTRWHYERQQAKERMESPEGSGRLLGVIPSGRRSATDAPVSPEESQPHGP